MTRPLKVNGVSAAVLAEIEKHRQEAIARCKKRTRYDELGARALGMKLMETSPEQRYIYKCKVCNGWHITRQPQPPYYAADYFVKGKRK